jgi:NADPH:quinone reductase-like Zn-dependent oxidoreductase
LEEPNLNLVHYFDLISVVRQLTRTCVIGEWVLVTAAAGGVGIAAVQIAKGLTKAMA